MAPNYKHKSSANAIKLWTRLITLCTALYVPHTVSAGGIRCSNTSISISAPTAEDASLACDAALWTIEYFKNCGLDFNHALRIEFVERISHPFGRAVIALFDAKRWQVEITQSLNFEKLINPKSGYRTLPPNDAYKSIIIHEIAHATFKYATQGRPLPVSAHEYVAYAVQFASLTSDAKKKLFAAFPKFSGQRDLSWFNDVVLAMAPLAFGVSAYRHLSEQQDRCITLREIAAGKLQFPIVYE